MNLDEINQILEMMREHELAEFELERDDFKLRLRKNTAGLAAAPVPHVNYVVAPPAAAPASLPVAPAGEPVLTAADEDVDLTIVKSPIVGTFYRAPEPGAKNFVDPGQPVRKG